MVSFPVAGLTDCTRLARSAGEAAKAADAESSSETVTLTTFGLGDGMARFSRILFYFQYVAEHTVGNLPIGYDQST